ncbi:RidA family protein [Abyssibacter sp.]|uniref:RidA family protein n=1 Tax=Abyssibacter sp. TaxID=2320200 RepID=UPI0035178574
MKRTSINPTEWGLQFSFDQGEIVEGANRHLRCSGQISVTPDSSNELGVAVVSPNEIRGQIECALANIDSILEEANMSRSNIVALRFFTTDIDSFLQNYDVYATWIAEAGIRPPQSLLGIQRLVLPEAMVEIEADAAA